MATGGSQAPSAVPERGNGPPDGAGQTDEGSGSRKVEVSGSDPTCLTFVVRDEDHTLGNALRYVLMKDKDVEFCGYNIPHPSDNFVNIRVQTLGGKPATDVFRKALATLAEMTDYIRQNIRDAHAEAEAAMDQ